tara:strand:- start:158 stop:1030 length:873 start_codon:yes stop_codon:yes gene_type:complete
MLNRKYYSDILDGNDGESVIYGVYFTYTGQTNDFHPFMVIYSKTIVEMPTRLMDVPNPPGTNINNSSYVTRTSKKDLKIYKIPMRDYGLITNLTDNVYQTLWDDEFDAGRTDSSTKNEWTYAGTSSIGVAIDGVKIYPLFNNTLVPAPEKGEITSNGCHVGQGLSLHWHCDGYGSNNNGLNLYNDDDYENHTHPPLIGFSFDGHALFGKYRTGDNHDGNTIALDEYGGHSHGSYGYHYHAHKVENVNPTTNVYNTNIMNIDPTTITYDYHVLLVGAYKGNINNIPYDDVS